MSCLARLSATERLQCRPVETATGAFVTPVTGNVGLCDLVLQKILDCKRGGSMAGPRPGMIVTRTLAGSGLAGTHRASRAEAHVAKGLGGGAPALGTRRSRAGDLGGLIGGTFAGDRGEQLGTLIGEGIDTLFGGRGRTTDTTRFAPGGATTCPEGLIRVGDTCVDLTALPPGGDPAFVPTSGTEIGGPGGTAVMGGFGVPAMIPRTETRIVRRCGRGMVLGADNLCYPKAILRRNSRFRKWRMAPRPPVTAADERAIRRAARTRDRVLELAKDVGLHASKSRPRSKK